MLIKAPANPRPSASAEQADVHMNAQDAALAEEGRYESQMTPSFGGGGRHQLQKDPSFAGYKRR